jgi:hypothetical protein
MPEQGIRLKRPEDFFKAPEDCRAIEEVKRELQESPSLLDAVQLREQEDWSVLADRVVGAEDGR